MIEFEMKLERDAAGLIVGIACRIGEGAAQRVAESVDLARVAELFLAVALEGGAAIEGRNPAAKLYQEYCVWAGRSGAAALPIKRFVAAMRAAGFRQIQSNGRKWFIPAGTAKRLRPRAPGKAGASNGSGLDRSGAAADKGDRGEKTLFEEIEKGGPDRAAPKRAAKS